MDAPVTCSRCGHPNTPRAKYCAECGLNLLLAGVPGSNDASLPQTRHWPRWLALAAILITLVLLYIRRRGL